MSEPEGSINGEKETPTPTSTTKKCQRLKYKTRDSDGQTEEEKEQQKGRAEGQAGPSGTPEKGCHPQLGASWVCQSLMHKRGT